MFLKNLNFTAFEYINHIYIFFIVECLRNGLQEALLIESCDKLYSDYLLDYF